MNAAERTHKAARAVAVLALFAAALYLVRELLAPICWAVVIAVASWGLHQRWLRRLGGNGRSVSAAALTSLVVLVLLAPIAYLVVESLRELPVAVQLWATGRESGLATPEWLARVPWLGSTLARQWAETLGQPGALAEYLHDAVSGFDLRRGSTVLLWVGHRLMALFFCVVTLFFLYIDGETLARQFDAILVRHFGESALATKRLAVDAMRATVNGVTVVGLALAVVMSVAYALAGVRHPATAGLATGVLGMVPFGAMVGLVAVALYLLAVGAQVAAVAVLAFGGIAIFVADHFVRPLFISGPSRMPLLLALFGIVGGLGTFGLLGLFIGPTLLAVVLTVWRELASAAPRLGLESRDEH